jgi:hypothetical protein
MRAAWFGLKVFYWAYMNCPGYVPAIFACLYSFVAVSFSITFGWQAYFNPWVYFSLFFLYLTHKNRKNYWKKNSEQIMRRLKGEQSVGR